MVKNLRKYINFPKVGLDFFFFLLLSRFFFYWNPNAELYFPFHAPELFKGADIFNRSIVCKCVCLYFVSFYLFIYFSLFLFILTNNSHMFIKHLFNLLRLSIRMVLLFLSSSKICTVISFQLNLQIQKKKQYEYIPT